MSLSKSLNTCQKVTSMFVFNVVDYVPTASSPEVTVLVYSPVLCWIYTKCDSVHIVLFLYKMKSIF